MRGISLSLVYVLNVRLLQVCDYLDVWVKYLDVWVNSSCVSSLPCHTCSSCARAGSLSHAAHVSAGRDGHSVAVLVTGGRFTIGWMSVNIGDSRWMYSWVYTHRS